MFLTCLNAIVINQSLKIFVDFSRYYELIQPIESPILVCSIPMCWKLPDTYSLSFFDMTHIQQQSNYRQALWLMYLSI